MDDGFPTNMSVDEDGDAVPPLSCLKVPPRLTLRAGDYIMELKFYIILVPGRS